MFDKPKTVKMVFAEDKFYNDPNVPLYKAGELYDIPENMVSRWLKRGGTIVELTPKEEAKAEVEDLGKGDLVPVTDELTLDGDDEEIEDEGELDGDKQTKKSDKKAIKKNKR